LSYNQILFNKLKPSMKLTYLSHLSAAAIFLLFSGGCAKQELQELTNESPAATANLRVSAEPSQVKIKRGNYIIISSTAGNLPANLPQQLAAAGGTLTGKMDKVGLATASSASPDFAAKAAKISGIKSVIQDFTVQWYDPSKERNVVSEDYGNPPASGDNDRFFDLQWGHDAIDAPEAWNAGYRGKGASVAVLDGGFDLDHPDLAPNIDLAASANFVPGEALQYGPANTFSHGTHVAGTVAAADNGFGIIGVAPEARLILVKVLRDAGSGSFSWLLSGIVHATNQGADVINMSLGAAIPRNGKFLDDNGTPDDPTDDFIVSDTKAVQELIVAISRVTTYAYQQGVTLISSAGNEANDGDKDKSLVHIPSDAPNVISISATAPRGWAVNPFTANLDFPASYTNFGTSVIDLAAPGGDAVYPGNEIVTIGGIRQFAYVFDLVFSTGNNGWYWSAGTSMASPHAAGVAALIIGKNGGNIKPSQVETILRASADDLGKPGKDAYYGHGRVNAYRAVANAQ
jgi:lantibiotic leader peptide-processing serine protease